MDTLFFVGRVLFGGYFLYNGVNHFVSHAMLAQYAMSKGVPMADLAVAASGVLLLFGGFSILAGLRPHIGLSCIALFLMCVTPVMHDFWAVADPNQRLAEMVNFTKNAALLGGVLMMAAVRPPWSLSLERRRRIAA